jgi:aconitate hydratase
VNGDPNLTKEKLLMFLDRLGASARSPGACFITGGGSALLLGWRETTIDIDLKFDPEPAGVFDAIPGLKRALHINVELAAPSDFLPPLKQWRERSRFIGKYGLVEVYHYDFLSQALSKLERGHAKDLLDVTEMLRRHGVVGKFVEFHGTGLSRLGLADRATISNMSPEFGATATLFPIDAETLRYLEMTGRPPETIARVEAYARAQGMFRTDDGPQPTFSEELHLDLSTVEPSVAGPRRPQDRVSLPALPANFRDAFPEALDRSATVQLNGTTGALRSGSVLIAAITSCTNTSNPTVMVAAGLLAQRAVARGLRVPKWVKTSFAPGSKAVTEYLDGAGLTVPLETLGFNLVGYGCTTCIGNSGPLAGPIAAAVEETDLVGVSVLSGNRNFEGRIHPLTRASYLASPPLVVAFALAGRIDIDLEREPLGTDSVGQPVYLADLWPSPEEISTVVAEQVRAEIFTRTYASVFDGDDRWRNLPVPTGSRYAWDEASTYVARPPFFEGLTPEPTPVADISDARVLVLVGDSVTTDHISPAGSIRPASPAGEWLIAHGVEPREFNSYGARRGHHQVLARGTFANIRLRNRLTPDAEGNVTEHLPDGERMSVFAAAEHYAAEGVPLVILAGKEYGSGSSRDWAAKGPLLMGVRAVIAESYERIHRSNLVGMGILPLQFLPDQTAISLGLTGRESFTISGIGNLRPGQQVAVSARTDAGATIAFDAIARLDGPIDLEYYRNGGLLPTVLRNLVREA